MWRGLDNIKTGKEGKSTKSLLVACESSRSYGYQKATKKGLLIPWFKRAVERDSDKQVYFRALSRAGRSSAIESSRARGGREAYGRRLLELSEASTEGGRRVIIISGQQRWRASSLRRFPGKREISYRLLFL